MNDTVSVLVPVYNGRKYVVELLESIKAQTYTPIELIIADDNSIDDSYDICRRWCRENHKRFFNIQIYRNEVNLQLSENTSKMMSLANGRYIFLSDQDDVWMADKVEIQKEYLDSHPGCMICLSDRSIADENLNVRIESEFSYLNYSIKSMDFQQFILHKSHGCSANKMCIRADIKEVLIIPREILEHDRFLASMAVCCGTIDYIYNPLVLYRIHRDNLSGNYSIQFSRNVLECFFRQYRVYKRLSGRQSMDNAIIKTEMKKRFGIDIDRYHHRLFSNVNTLDSVFQSALRTTKIAKANNLIGAWL